MRLADKTVLITGAGSGFGEGMACRFAAEGARVVVNDLDAARGEAVVRAIGESGGEAHFIRADVADGRQVKALVDASIAALGGLDIVINNAGVAQRNGPSFDVPEGVYDRIFNVNVKSVYHMAVRIVPHFRARGGGVFLNTASTAALRPRPGLTWYNASKGAVLTMTKSMAIELAPDGIRVNALCPVAGETGLLAEFMGGAVTAEMREKFVATIPLGRLSTPIDIANAALFLCSDEAALITGTCLEVDGGRCI